MGDDDDILNIPTPDSSHSNNESSLSSLGNNKPILAPSKEAGLLMPSQLYGRDDEAKLLLEAYSRSKTPPNSNSVGSRRRRSSIGSSISIGSNNSSNSANDGKLLLNELVLIQGRSGTGKTALANSLRPLVDADGGFFLSGKFEQARCQDPYAVFVSAFTQFVSHVMGDHDDHHDDHHHNVSSSQDERLSLIRQTIIDAVGNDGVLLTEMIPSLERIMGVQEKTVTLTGPTEARNRFQFVFCNFCHAISTIAPLVLLVDDLQWSDQASLELLQSLLLPSSSGSSGSGSSSLSGSSTSSSRPSQLLVVATYRDDEIDQTPFSRVLQELWLHQPDAAAAVDAADASTTAAAAATATTVTTIGVTKINLTNLNEASLNELLAGMLQLPSELTWQLALIIHSKSNGNVFHALQYLGLLMENNIVHLADAQSLKQSLDNHQVWQANYMAEKSVDQLIQRKLEELPNLAQEVLQIAACMSDEIDETALGTVLDGKTLEISKALEIALHHDLVTLVKQRGRYRFHHDRIRQASFDMIENPNVTSFHIGYKLWQKSSPMFLATKIFVVVSLLNKGTALLKDPDERYQAASLNLEAGRKAASLAAFPDAATYLRAAMEFLKGGISESSSGSDHWVKEYDLSLNIFNAATDAELCNQNFTRVQELIGEVLSHAKTPTDKLVAHSAKINAIGQTGCVREATEYGLQVLAELGEVMPLQPGTFAIISEFIKTKNSLRGKTNEDILTLPPMEDELKIGAVHILNLLLPYSFQAGLSCSAMIGPRLVRLCLSHGIMKACATGFVTFAWMLCRSESKEGYRYGQLALKMVERYRAREMIPRVAGSYYDFTHHWTHHLRETLLPLRDMIKLGLETGDVEYAMYAAYFHGSNALNAGTALPLLENMLWEALEQMRLYKQDNTLQTTEPLLQYVHNMTGRAPNPKLLCGDIVKEEDVNTENMSVLNVLYCLGVDLAYMFGDYALAESIVMKRKALPFEQFALYSNSLDHFREGLVAVAQGRAGINRRKNIIVAKQELKKMVKWASDCPDNFSHKRYLLEAEIKSLVSSSSSHLSLRTISKRHIQGLYDKAIEKALQQGFIQEAALACERAGDYMHSKGNTNGSVSATSYWTRSHALYLEWGATAKASQLQARTGLSI